MWLLLGLGLIILVVFLLFVGLLFVKLTVRIQFKYLNQHSQLQLSLYLYNLKLFTRDIPLNQMPDNEWTFSNFRQDIREYIRNLKTTYRQFIGLLSLMELKYFEWRSSGGTGDAFTTGISSGGIWTIKGVCVGFLGNHMNMSCRPIIQVFPDYQKKYLQTKIDCMISIRLGKAIRGIMNVKKESDNHKEATNHERTSN